MKCGACTLCCKLLELHEIKSDIGVWCEHCDPKDRCRIHERKPSECATYKCTWRQMENVGEELRPDKSHIIFDKLSDNTICARQDEDYEVSNIAIKQIYAFKREGFSVIVLIGNEKQVHLAAGHTMERVKEDLNDNSSIY